MIFLWRQELNFFTFWPNQLGLQNALTASLQRDKIPPYGCPGYDIKQSDGEAPVMLEHWGMRSTPLLPLLPGPLWPGMLAPDSPIYIGQIELNCVFILNWIVWNGTITTIL